MLSTIYRQHSSSTSSYFPIQCSVPTCIWNIILYSKHMEHCELCFLHPPVILVWYPPGSTVWTDTPSEAISLRNTSVYASTQYLDTVYGAGGKANRPTTLAVFTTRPPASLSKGRNVFVTLTVPSKLMFMVVWWKSALHGRHEYLLWH